jgi:pimeloyl-ACP methyl ester carboxylesterase
VLLVHGFTGSKEDFAALLPELAVDGWHAVAVDLPGQHESPPLDDPDAATLAASVQAAALQLAEESAAPVHVVGHSLGGLLTRRAVIDDAGAMASLTLLCSGASAVERPEQREPLVRFAAAMAAGRADAVWSVMRETVVTVTSDHEIVTFLERRLLSGDPRTHAAFARILLEEPDLTDSLARVTLPKHVAFGAQDDAWGPEHQERMADRLGAHRSVLAAAGHSPAVEDPVSTARVLTDWWAGLVHDAAAEERR